MNVFCIVGQIEKLPVLKETSTGLKTCEVELKVIRPFSNSEGEFENDYITVEVWRGLAETIDNDNLKITNYDHLKFTKNGKF